jgi:hypothetical protein
MCAPRRGPSSSMAVIVGPPSWPEARASEPARAPKPRAMASRPRRACGSRSCSADGRSGVRQRVPRGRPCADALWHDAHRRDARSLDASRAARPWLHPPCAASASQRTSRPSWRCRARGRGDSDACPSGTLRVSIMASGSAPRRGGASVAFGSEAEVLPAGSTGLPTVLASRAGHNQPPGRESSAAGTGRDARTAMTTSGGPWRRPPRGGPSSSSWPAPSSRTVRCRSIRAPHTSASQPTSRADPRRLREARRRGWARRSR